MSRLTTRPPAMSLILDAQTPPLGKCEERRGPTSLVESFRKWCLPGVLPEGQASVDRLVPLPRPAESRGPLPLRLPTNVFTVSSNVHCACLMGLNSSCCWRHKNVTQANQCLCTFCLDTLLSLGSLRRKTNNFQPLTTLVLLPSIPLDISNKLSSWLNGMLLSEMLEAFIAQGRCVKMSRTDQIQSHETCLCAQPFLVLKNDLPVHLDQDLLR